MNCPLAEAFTRTPSVIYPNFLKKFWCTSIAYDPNPPADDSKARPLKEYKIKFIMMNGKNTLTLEFKTFVDSTSLDYNEGTYVSHPTLEFVKDELAKIVMNLILLDRTPILKTAFRVAWRILFTFIIQDDKFRSSPAIPSNSKFSKDPSNVTPIELTASMIVVNNRETSVSPLLFSIKRKKKKFQIVTQTLPNSQGLEASRALSKKRTKPKYKNTTLRPKQHHLGKTTNPKDSGGNDQPANKGLPSMASNEGTSKTMPLSKGPRKDKDLERFVPLADMESQTPPITNLSGTDVELDFEPLKLTSMADFQALLGDDDKQ
ncbi:hypothetical protein Tco_1312535 [Tanacetum coccineum]